MYWVYKLPKWHCFLKCFVQFHNAPNHENGFLCQSESQERWIFHSLMLQHCGFVHGLFDQYLGRNKN